MDVVVVPTQKNKKDEDKKDVRKMRHGIEKRRLLVTVQSSAHDTEHKTLFGDTDSLQWQQSNKLTNHAERIMDGLPAKGCQQIRHVEYK